MPVIWRAILVHKFRPPAADAGLDCELSHNPPRHLPSSTTQPTARVKRRRARNYVVVPRRSFCGPSHIYDASSAIKDGRQDGRVTARSISLWSGGRCRRRGGLR
jgi:hypothetical protein